MRCERASFSGLLASSILKAQTFSPTFSHVYAALVAIINSKFPTVGQLVLKRLIIQFKRAFRTNNKALCVTVCMFPRAPRQPACRTFAASPMRS